MAHIDPILKESKSSTQVSLSAISQTTHLVDGMLSRFSRRLDNIFHLTIHPLRALPFVYMIDHLKSIFYLNFIEKRPLTTYYLNIALPSAESARAFNSVTMFTKIMPLYLFLDYSCYKLRITDQDHIKYKNLPSFIVYHALASFIIPYYTVIAFARIAINHVDFHKINLEQHNKTYKKYLLINFAVYFIAFNFAQIFSHGFLSIFSYKKNKVSDNKIILPEIKKEEIQAQIVPEIKKIEKVQEEIIPVLKKEEKVIATPEVTKNEEVKVVKEIEKKEDPKAKIVEINEHNMDKYFTSLSLIADVNEDLKEEKVEVRPVMSMLKNLFNSHDKINKEKIDGDIVDVINIAKVVDVIDDVNVSKVADVEKDKIIEKKNIVEEDDESLLISIEADNESVKVSSKITKH